jgi:hypothetical protein
MCTFRGLLGLIVAVVGGMPAYGQTTTTDWAWRPLLEHDGVSFTYLFYSHADTENNGVVLKLANTNKHAVAYRFKIIFRTLEEEHEEEVTGYLGPLQVKTGDPDGLFWIPFRDGQTIAEVGLRGYHVEPVPDDTAREHTDS